MAQGKEKIKFACALFGMASHRQLDMLLLDFRNEFLNSIWLLVLHVSPESSFVLTQFFVLNLDG